MNTRALCRLAVLRPGDVPFALVAAVHGVGAVPVRRPVGVAAARLGALTPVAPIGPTTVH